MTVTRWGIFSAGKISHDFVSALASLPAEEHAVIAVAARSLESAKTFADAHKIPKAYGSYEELAQDPEVQVIYVGAINPQHVTLIKLAINNGKGVLCEKPMCVNVRETQEVVELARAKKVFLMEGIWSRAFPAYHRLRELLDSQEIGDVVQVIINFGTILTHKDRCRLKELGGGAMLDIGVYCVQLCSFIFNGLRPEKIVAAGHLNSDGIDDSSSSTVIYPNGKTATLIVNGTVRMDSVGSIVGTKGTITVPSRFWCPTELITPNGVEKFDLPPSDKTFNYANSVGLSYEAQEVRRCLTSGLLESPLINLDETLVIAEMMESIRKQVGVVYPQDL
ncbi:unnamed protein product [Allacma fusca]|uniref:Trans-1,2-dihydrobenzene-1,2-diol dehydrogenase n=1 Tax=Allacma fusca TaxID=39272 RepID=A0A8J2LRR4_9HEXA|nr:unnamed protein product [Allacma fusca]